MLLPLPITALKILLRHVDVDDDEGGDEVEGAVAVVDFVEIFVAILNLFNHYKVITRLLSKIKLHSLKMTFIGHFSKRQF